MILSDGVGCETTEIEYTVSKGKRLAVPKKKGVRSIQ
jgi:hypothetical protein